MKFKLEFNMDNASFDDDPENEILNTLVDVGKYVLRGLTSRTIQDLNGNTIGNWEIEID